MLREIKNPRSAASHRCLQSSRAQRRPLVMNISVLAAGAGGMYGGSCMRDNALAQALRRQGHSVTLIPLYTPLRSEAGDASDTEIFYGGLNVYLQHTARVFRHTPRVFDWIFDRPWLLDTAGKLGAQM